MEKGGEAVECAECESERAEIVCLNESLPYCNSCSLSLHSKKARAHHTLLPIPSCSQCHSCRAKYQCFQCASYASANVDPAFLCAGCNIAIHSSPSLAAHDVCILTILTRFVEETDLLAVKQEDTVSENRRKTETCLNRKLPSQKRGRLQAKVKVKKGPNQAVVKKEIKSGAGFCNVRQNSKTRRAARKAVFDQSAESDDYDDSDFEVGKGFGRIQRGSISLEAFVVNGEDDGAEDENGFRGLDEQNQEAEPIRGKIRKMLELGLHPDTPEAEAQQALKNAQRLLTKYNLQQAELMADALKDSVSLAGGMRVVQLRSKGKTGGQGRFQRWTLGLAGVIADNFDTQYFTTRYARKDRHLEVTFYGIKQNADCSGYAFAATFNRITIMSAKYNPIQNPKIQRNDASVIPTATVIARNNYRWGIVAGLRKSVQDSKAAQNPHKIKKVEALVLHSKEVGEAYLKQKGIKFAKKKHTKTNNNSLNLEAFAQGLADSKQININQKALKAPNRMKPYRKRRKIVVV